jgi:hypothetical protein
VVRERRRGPKAAILGATNHDKGTIRLTYPFPTDSTADDRPATKPTDEIEITSEMIDAGVRFLESSMVDSFMSIHREFVEDFLRSAIVGGCSRKSDANL